MLRSRVPKAGLTKSEPMQAYKVETDGSVYTVGVVYYRPNKTLALQEAGYVTSIEVRNDISGPHCVLQAVYVYDHDHLIFTVPLYAAEVHFHSPSKP